MRSCGIWAEPDRAPDRACRVCGCTDDDACEGGCGWADVDLCTSCEGRPAELHGALVGLANAVEYVASYDRALAAGGAVNERAALGARAAVRRALKQARVALKPESR